MKLYYLKWISSNGEAYFSRCTFSKAHAIRLLRYHSESTRELARRVVTCSEVVGRLWDLQLSCLVTVADVSPSTKKTVQSFWKNHLDLQVLVNGAIRSVMPWCLLQMRDRRRHDQEGCVRLL